MPKAKWYYYFLALPFYALALLPFPVLYFLSDMLSFFALNIIRYRKKVVYMNLQKAFPEKGETEIADLARRYYTNMTDVFLETFRSLVMSRTQMSKRWEFVNDEICRKFYNEGRSVIFLVGHQGNWEWSGTAYTYYSAFPMNSLYHPLSNGFFNWLMYRLRTRGGLGLIPMQSVARWMLSHREKVNTIAFIADQSPQPTQAYWTTFLNQDTGFFTGAEKLAVKYNVPVMNAEIHRKKRGHYVVTFFLIEAEPSSAAPDSITEKYARSLEESIRRYPEQWLWSHRRWKHRRVEN